MGKIKKTSIIDVDDVLPLLRIVSKNWYFVVLFLLFSLGLSFFYTHKLPNIYAVKSQILLKAEETYDYQTQLYKGLGAYQAYQDNANQIRVITSNDLIGKAISKLKL